MTGTKQKSFFAVAALLGALVVLWLSRSDVSEQTRASATPSEADTGGSESVKGAERGSQRESQSLEAPEGVFVLDQATLTDEEALRASIKSISCFPEFAGKDVLTTDELTPTREGIQAMEGCLDLVGARFPQEASVELTTVFYLSPDGSVFETGVGADVGSLEAWDVLEPCAREYWLANAPKVRASDEKSFSCVYSWSVWSLTGGVHRVGAQVPSVLSGRGSVAFGKRVTDVWSGATP